METWKWKRTWNVGKLEKWCRSEEAVKLEVTGGRGLAGPTDLEVTLDLIPSTMGKHRGFHLTDLPHIC